MGVTSFFIMLTLFTWFLLVLLGKFAFMIGITEAAFLYICIFSTLRYVNLRKSCMSNRLI